MKKEGFIYKISNNINEKVFIGYGTTSLAQVRAIHRTNLKHGHNPENRLYEAMREFGYAAFTYEGIETVDITVNKDELLERYRQWMSHYDSIDNGYNEKRGKRANGGYEISNQGEDHYKAKLAEEDVKVIRLMLEKNVPFTDIADWFGVTPSNINAIKMKKNLEAYSLR